MTTVWLPTDPPRPCPSLMTDQELVLFLRLDEQQANPTNTINYYVGEGWLKPTRIGRNNRYRLEEVLEFLKKKQDRDNGESNRAITGGVQSRSTNQTGTRGHRTRR